MKNEKILCIPTPVLKKNFPLSNNYWGIDILELNQLPYEYLPRCQVETNFSFKQLIPYAIVSNNDNQILTYQRHGSEKRLSGMLSAGFGGHVNDQDSGNNLFQRITAGLQREITEEIGLLSSNYQLSLLGMIDEEITNVGFFHTGIVFHINTNQKDFLFDNEIAKPEWISPQDMDLTKFELWSQLAMKFITP